jgi:hypothetical protein
MRKVNNNGAKRHCEERSDEATQRKKKRINNEKRKIKIPSGNIAR